MRVLRLLLIVSLVLAVGCGSDDQASEPDADPIEAASAEPSDTAAPAGDESEEAQPATALFVPLPDGYSYVDPPKEVREQLAGQIGSVEDNAIIADVGTTYVEKGSVPVAAIVAFRFSAAATSADLNDFATGVEQGAEGKSESVPVGGQDVTYIDSEPKGFLYMGDDFGLLFFGDSRDDLEPVVEAVVSKV